MVEKSQSIARNKDWADRPTYLAQLRDEIDQLFEGFPRSGWFDPIGGMQKRFANAILAIDVVDTDEAVRIVAEVPGVAEDDIDVQVVNNSVLITGEKEEEREEGTRNSDYYVCERSFGSFERAVPIPEGVDRDKIEASVKNGVLTVHMPKKPEGRQTRKKINVTSA